MEDNYIDRLLRGWRKSTGILTWLLKKSGKNSENCVLLRSILRPLLLSVSSLQPLFLRFLNAVRPIISVYNIITVTSETFAKSALVCKCRALHGSPFTVNFSMF